MMLEHLGENAAAAMIMTAVEEVLDLGEGLTPDLGGIGTTASIGKAIADKLR
jgi:tartrate dehydrogenase/decarboxylase / D-malate dehydrogenase